MMRSKLLGAMVLVYLTLATGNVKAETPIENLLQQRPTVLSSIEPKKEEKPKLVVYVVVAGDTLKSVSDAHTTTWERVWARNPHLTHPDVLNPGEKLAIPQADEVLPERPLPVESVVITPRSVVPGNTYAPGYCTWYVKQRRPDLPNRMGNADRWYIAAQRAGLPTGIIPKVGAAGVTKRYMHVVYIEAVHPDGTVTVSEMNYRGRGVVSSRTTLATEFNYIY